MVFASLFIVLKKISDINEKSVGFDTFLLVLIFYITNKFLVEITGIEPAPISGLDPKSSASASFAISPGEQYYNTLKDF